MLTLEGVSSIFACSRQDYVDIQLPSRAFGAWSRLGQSDVGEKALGMMMERCKEYILSADIKLANLLRRLHRPPECRYGEAQNV